MGGAKRVMQFRVPEVLAERMTAIADDLGCSVNAWAIRAFAYAAKNHVPLEAYINTKGKGRAARLSPFTGLLVDPLGIPEGVNIVDGELELHRKLKEEGADGVKRFMQLVWNTGGINKEYSDAHLAETLRVLNGGE